MHIERKDAPCQLLVVSSSTARVFFGLAMSFHCGVESCRHVPGLQASEI